MTLGVVLDRVMGVDFLEDKVTALGRGFGSSFMLGSSAVTVSVMVAGP